MEDLIERALTAKIETAAITTVNAAITEAGTPDLAVATSKTFRSLARLTGAAPSGAGLRVQRQLTASCRTPVNFHG